MANTHEILTELVKDILADYGSINVMEHMNIQTAIQIAADQIEAQQREQVEKLKIELERLIEVHLMDCEEDCVAIEVARKALAESENENND